MGGISVALVTHDSARWIRDTLTSIVVQSTPPDRVVVVDDHSGDDTVSIVREVLPSAHIEPSRSSAGDITTRIASNFTQAVRAAGDAEIVVLGDHDDIWHPHRIEHQALLLRERQGALMTAGDGILIDEQGAPISGTLRTHFPIPPDFGGLTPAEQLRFGLDHSVATGGASALRPAAFPDLAVPPGWLHDRWWSLVALVRAGMLIDSEPVISYRVSPRQRVGLDRGSQGVAGSSRLGRIGPVRALGRARDLHDRLRPLATVPQLSSELSWTSLLGHAVR